MPIVNGSEVVDLIWSKNGVVLASLPLPIGFPGVMGEAQILTLTSSALSDGSLQNLTGVKFYLAGDPDQIDVLLSVWPYFGSQPGAIPSPGLNGGVEVSFDSGVSFQRLCRAQFGNPGLGDPADPTTWIPLPLYAVSPTAAADGELGAFSSAQLILRYNVPALATQYQVFTVRLEAAFDVV